MRPMIIFLGFMVDFKKTLMRSCVLSAEIIKVRCEMRSLKVGENGLTQKRK